MATIELPFGHNNFESDDLIEHITATGRDCIIQGQKACNRTDHPKPNSLDCWLRDNYAKNPDIKQAVNVVIEALLKTGDFKVGQFMCPDSGRMCKGIRCIKSRTF
jgi:hypothetical protein